MNVARQTAAVTWLNLQNLPRRLGSSSVIVIGITGVVAVLVSVLALSTGFQRTMANSAREDRAVVLSRGAGSESASNLPRSSIPTVFDAPGIRRNAEGNAIGSAEALIIAPVARKKDGVDAYVTLRGIGPRASELRSELKVISGRMFRPAVRELIVGRAAQARFSGLEVGSQITLRGGEWTVVGTFESGGSAHESGLLADAETVISAYQHNGFTSVTVRLASPELFSPFKDALMANPSLDVDVRRETDYIATVSRPLHRLLNLLAYAIGGIMATGALFGALNTLFSAVSARSREIATLRALGFSAVPIIVSVFIEALVLTLLGACLGATLAFVSFNGNAISTIGGMIRESQLIYEVTVTSEIIAWCVSLALLVGLLGAAFPAIRAVRLSIPSGFARYDRVLSLMVWHGSDGRLHNSVRRTDRDRRLRVPQRRQLR
jgi:putative ABC transport system permease protein